MKNIVALCLCLLFSVAVFGQDEMETLSKVEHHGFYLAPQVKISSVRGEIVPMVGGKVAWTINKVVALGLEGNALIPMLLLSDIVPSQKIRPIMGYGGFFVEPIFFSNKVVHLTTPIAVGSGWTGYFYDWNNNNNSDLLDQQVFWYIEPSLNVEVNLTKSMRFYAGASYRVMKDVKIFESQYNDFKGVNYQIGLKFGRF